MGENLDRSFFFKDGIYKTHKPSIDQIVDVIRNANPTSEFGKKISHLIGAPYEEIIKFLPVLPTQNYDALIIYQNGKNLGHVAFQEHVEEDSKEWHAFQWYVVPKQRNKGYSYTLALEMIEQVRENGIPKLKAGKPGNHPLNSKLLKMLDENSKRLNLNVNKETHFIDVFSSVIA